MSLPFSRFWPRMKQFLSPRETMFGEMGQHVADLDDKIEALDRRLLDQHKVNPVSQRLAAIPGVGPITAITMALTVDPGNFKLGRHLAAWLGLTPREHSTAGKHRPGKISKAGNERLRQLLVVGAMSVIRCRQTRQAVGIRLAVAIAGAQAAQTRGGGSGQQDGPDHLGHDGAWRGISASAGYCRLTRAPVPKVQVT